MAVAEQIRWAKIKIDIGEDVEEQEDWRLNPQLSQGSQHRPVQTILR